MPSSKCQGWCPPTIIYVFISTISIIVSLVSSHKYDEMQTNGKNKIYYTLYHLVVMGFWTLLLYTLCSSCYYKTAWFVLLFPFIIVFVSLFLFVFILSTTKEKKIVLQ